MQQQQGIASTGKPFINKNTGTSEYSPSYAKRKGKKAPIDLHDKGDFQNDMLLDVRTDIFIIDSANEKTQKLLDQFGPDIFGLDYESRVIAKPELQTELVNLVKQQLQK